VAAKAADLVNQQLALMQTTRPDAAAAADPDELPPAPPTIRLHLQMMQPPLPLLSVPEVAQQAVANSSKPPLPPPLPMSCLGVVTGTTVPAEVVWTQRFICHACGSTTDVTPHERNLPCCNTPRSEWAKEDLTGRHVLLCCVLCAVCCVLCAEQLHGLTPPTTPRVLPCRKCMLAPG
jgi:hypothetical protein